MVIYGDILFVFNMVVDYLLLGITALFLKTSIGTFRQILSAMLGGLSSFYIFLESSSFLVDILFKFIISYLMMLITFGIKKQKKCLIGLLVFVTVSMLLSGIADFVSTSFSLKLLKVNNGYVYMGISPIMLIVLSLIFYFVFQIVFRINKNKVATEKCKLEIALDGRTGCFEGLIDSGNMLTDLLSDSEIFIASDRVVTEICKMNIENYFKISDNQKRCRLIPLNTVNGSSCLYGVRCDSAIITVQDKKIEVSKPIIALSEHISNEDYDVIIPKGATEGIF